MAERIDIRIHVRDDGKVRAYAERKVVPGITRPGRKKLKQFWPREFYGPEFVTCPDLDTAMNLLRDSIGIIREVGFDDPAE